MRGSLKRRGHDSWSLIVDLPRRSDGRRNQKRFTIHGRRREAELTASRLMAKLASARGLPSSEPFAVYLDRWLEEREANVEPSTFRRYKSIVEGHIRPKLGATPVCRISPLDIQGAVQDWQSKKRRRSNSTLTQRTVRHIFDTVKAILHQLVRWDVIDSNPCDCVARPRSLRKSAKALELPELACLLNALKPTDVFIAALMAATGGFRRGEVLALRWCDIDFQLCTVQVCRSLSRDKANMLYFKSPKTRKSTRTVTLPRIVVQILERYREQQKSNDDVLGLSPVEDRLICSQADASPWDPDVFSARFYYLVHSKALPHTNFHGLRHTYASLSLKAGTPIKVTSDLLGHAGISITADLYTHVFADGYVNAAERLNDLLTNVDPALGDTILSAEQREKRMIYDVSGRHQPTRPGSYSFVKDG